MQKGSYDGTYVPNPGLRTKNSDMSQPEAETEQFDSPPSNQPMDYNLISDYNFTQKAELEEMQDSGYEVPRRKNIIGCKEIEFDNIDVFPHTENFHEQLRLYNNNKLFWPNICSVHNVGNYRFRKIPGEVMMADLKINLTVLSIEESLIVQTVVTNYRLLFLPDDPKYLSARHLRSDYFSIPLMLISTFRKTGEKRNHLSNFLDIATKCGRKFRMCFSLVDDTQKALQLIEVLQNLVPPPKIYNCFAFAFYSTFPEYEEKYKGWSVYDMNKEYTRQGVLLLPKNATKEDFAKAKSSSDLIPFKVFDNFAGQDGWLCETYPPEIVVPALVETDEVIKCAKYRTKHRLPVLTFCYKNSGRVATLWRSSQCKPGFASKRSNEDEYYLRLMGGMTRDSREGLITLHIYDARPFLNAMANRAGGKGGYENINHYRNTEIFFLDIDNIHGVRDRYKKLVELSASLNTGKLTSSLDYSGWVDSLAYILAGAKMIVEKSLKQGISALIHCSDGWDRTTQLNSLVQIMLDPYFRTIEGFQVLVEKDWVSFGHMFKSRYGWKPTGAFDEDKRAPVFIQFLDCVHQLLNQFPAEFEYNLRFLTDIGYYSRTGLFGTFLSDNYEEMLKLKVQENTTSIWSFINANQDMYKSSLYKALAEHSVFLNREIVPDTSLINMRFWREFFCFYARNALEEANGNVELDSKNDLYEITLALQMKKNDTLKHENDALFDRIKELTAELAKFKVQQTPSHIPTPQSSRKDSSNIQNIVKEVNGTSNSVAENSQSKTEL